MGDEIDSRMEQIRLKNEELEKKHQEILQDELEAKKQNAIVSLTLNSAEKKYIHPYDNKDLDFDVKISEEERIELSKNPNAKTKNTRKPILNKKSLDEIPPDPVNFLREDNGSEGKNDQQQQQQRPPQQQNRNRKPQQHQQQQRPRGGPYNNNNNNNRNNAQSLDSNEAPSSLRPREQHNNNSRPRGEHNNMRRQNDNKMETSNSPTAAAPSPRRPHPQALRNERRTVSSNAAAAATSTAQSNPETNVNDDETQQPQQGNRQKRPNQKPPRAHHNNSGNKDHHQNDRNNITVQLTDEVRSVKIRTSERRVGSGRVAHSINNQSDGNDVDEKAQSPGDEGNRNKNKNPKNRRNFKPKAPPGPEFHHPVLDKIVITKTSVQERLLKSRMSEDAIISPDTTATTDTENKIDVDDSTTTTTTSTAATPEIIENNNDNEIIGN